MEDIVNSTRAELIKAETALTSFRDSGFSFDDTIAEYCDNSIQASATEFRVDWIVEQDTKKATQRRALSIAIADNGSGISPQLLAHCLTIGFGTRLNDRNGIGKYGVGFKLATLNQAKRLTIFSKPRFLEAMNHLNEDGTVSWTFTVSNTYGKIFKTYLDLDEIIAGDQQEYVVEECEDFPDEYFSLMNDVDNKPYSQGSLFIIEKLDKFNERKSYAENIDQKFSDLAKFLARSFRIYIDNGFNIFLGSSQNSSLSAYDPSFQLENDHIQRLTETRSGEDRQHLINTCKRLGVEVSFAGIEKESGDFMIDGHKVKWSVFLTPEIVRIREQLGGEHFHIDGDKYFTKLHIPDNEGKISFLRQDREISYTIIPKLFPSGIQAIDRHIGITISFPAYLDEYFQVRHIKRGAQPVDKLKDKIKQVLKKPINDARKDIRKLWQQTAQLAVPQSEGGDLSGGRTGIEESAKEVDKTLPKGPAGYMVSPAQEHIELKKIAEDSGILDPKDQETFAQNAKLSPIIAIERAWPGKGLIDIRHLTNTVVVYLNSNHPFIKKVYLPLKSALQDDTLPYEIASTLKNAVEGIDLLLFAYAKAENQSMDPEDDFDVLREDWGKFTAVYLKKWAKWM